MRVVDHWLTTVTECSATASGLEPPLVIGRLDLHKRRKLSVERDLARAFEGRPNVGGKKIV